MDERLGNSSVSVEGLVGATNNESNGPFLRLPTGWGVAARED